MSRSAAILVILASHALGVAQVSSQSATVTLGAGMHLIQAEVANTDESRMRGLMFRKSLGPNSGMIFAFPAEDKYCMWMRNTYIPLSVAFLDGSGHVVSIHEMLPQTENSHCAAAPARYALEMNAGWFRSKGIYRGARIAGIDKVPAPR